MVARSAAHAASAAAAPQMMEEPQAHESEDLEIPSFLRRLAN